jgi:hypothetical protein
MRIPRDLFGRRTLAVTVALALAAATARAASHREAPLMTLDPGADVSDVYAFVGYDAANRARPLADRRVTLVMNVVPGQEPSSGPNYFAFDDDVLYSLHVDNDRDGRAEDVVYEFRFATETTAPDQFVATLGGGPLPPVDSPEAAGLSRKQRVTVTELRDCRETRRGLRCDQRLPLFGGAAMPTVPSNIGPRTMPAYEALAAQGVLTDPGTGIRVFAGQRAETFAIDLGAVFDTLNLRVENASPIAGARPPLPVMTNAEDANDAVNPFGVNAFSGFNVNTIAIEVPIRRLTRDGGAPTADTGTLGVYASTARRRVTVRRGAPSVDPNRPPKALLKAMREYQQVSRMANPLVNELIIPIGQKDLWNATDPADEAAFLDAYRALAVASALNAVSGVPVPAPPREDVVGLLLKYAGQDPSPTVGPFAELLRLDTTVPPTAPADIKRLGPLAHDASGAPTPDPAGFPNGRRPNDDVTDLVVRVAGGQAFIDNRVGDGVGISENGITPDFPFLPTPFDGRNRRHRDPGE